MERTVFFVKTNLDNVSIEWVGSLLVDFSEPKVRNSVNGDWLSSDVEEWKNKIISLLHSVRDIDVVEYRNRDGELIRRVDFYR